VDVPCFFWLHPSQTLLRHQEELSFRFAAIRPPRAAGGASAAAYHSGDRLARMGSASPRQAIRAGLRGFRSRLYFFIFPYSAIRLMLVLENEVILAQNGTERQSGRQSAHHALGGLAV
jgi:hypothetical protein